MTKQVHVIAAVSLLLLLGAGCGKQAVQTTPEKAVPVAAEEQVATPTSDAFMSFVRGSLAGAGITSYTESDEAGDVAKMSTKDAIVRATKFKFSEGSGSVRLLVIAVKDAGAFASVKAEVEAQYAGLQKLSSSARINWLAGDATHVAVVNFKAGDEAAAEKIVSALGGEVAAANDGEAQAEVSASVGQFNTGDKVVANWKAGSKWWDAVVTAVNGNKISVMYTSDKTTDVLDMNAVAHLNQPNSEINPGDKVVAKWSDGSYYSATVVSFSDTGVKVKWSDTGALMDLPYSSVEMPGR